MTTSEQRLHQAYAAFNSRDIDAALRLMHPQVQWPNGWEGGWVHGHDEVRAYWMRQWQVLNPQVTPISIEERTDGRLAVHVHQVVKDKQGTVLMDGTVLHVYKIENGLVVKMEIEEP